MVRPSAPQVAVNGRFGGFVSSDGVSRVTVIVGAAGEITMVPHTESLSLVGRVRPPLFTVSPAPASMPVTESTNCVHDGSHLSMQGAPASASASKRDPLPLGTYFLMRRSAEHALQRPSVHVRSPSRHTT